MNLKSKTDEYREKKTEANQKTDSLNYREHIEDYWRGGGWGDGLRVMGIKEDTCDEHWVIYVSDESRNSKPETNIAVS